MVNIKLFDVHMSNIKLFDVQHSNVEFHNDTNVEPQTV